MKRTPWKAEEHSCGGTWGVCTADANETLVVWEVGGCNEADAKQIAREHNTYNDLLAACEAAGTCEAIRVDRALRDAIAKTKGKDR